MPGQVECSFSGQDGEGCQFPELEAGGRFEFHGDIFCRFHAPLDAVAPSNGKLKCDIDVGAFNDAILNIIAEVTEEHPDYERVRKPPPGASTTTFLFRTTLREQAKTIGLTNLNGTVFPGPLRLSGIVVTDLSLCGCVFPGELELTNCTVRGDLICRKSTFSQGANFTEAEFKGQVRITDCAFESFVYFSDAAFAREIYIERSSFRLLHLCRSAGEATIADELKLKECRFNSYVCMKNRRFSLLDVSGSIFDGELNLAGSQVGDDVAFSQAQYGAVSPQGRRFYAILRRLAGQVGDLRAVETFRALEFECQARDPAVPLFMRGMLRLYGLGSRFGTDASRPLLLLALLSLLVFALVALLLFFRTGQAGAAMSGAAWHFMTNVLRYPAEAVPLNDAAAAYLHQPSWVLVALTTLQNFGTYLLIALFAHALYRMFSRA